MVPQSFGHDDFVSDSVSVHIHRYRRHDLGEGSMGIDRSGDSVDPSGNAERQVAYEHQIRRGELMDRFILGAYPETDARLVGTGVTTKQRKSSSS